MIESLQIRNFALIENLEIDFSKGFNVITGETGAGKSIILDALGLLLGEKADSQAVRTGAEECVVNALVSIPQGHPVLDFLKERGIEAEDDSVTVRRVVRANGSRGLISIQGQSVSRNELVCFMDSLIDMHSQHEHQSLVHFDRQRRILDSYARNQELVASYQQSYQRLLAMEQEKSDFEDRLRKAQMEKDYLEFAVSEISKVDPHPGEDQEIKDQIAVISNYEMLSENLQLAINAVSSAKDLLFDAESDLVKAMKADSTLADLSGRVESLRIENEDVFETLRDRISNLSFSQEKLDSLQERLMAIRRLRKYGAMIEDVIAFCHDAKNTLHSAEKTEIELSRLENMISKQKNEVLDLAQKLSSARKKAALVLQKLIEASLSHLGMPSGKFIIEILPSDLGLNGMDDVNFLISPNKGEPPKLISQIASGGELSRVMLAIKTVLAEVDDTQTQVFDEVDAGIGGTVAQAVGIQLCNLARSRQVVVITHLASIAAMADAQFIVSKHEEAGRTFSCIAFADEESRIHEIARMLSGDENEESLRHAQALLHSS